MSDVLLPRNDVIAPEELLLAAGAADSFYDRACEAYEFAEQDPGSRRQSELVRAKYIRWLVNECYYGEPCDYETGSPNWAVSPEEAINAGHNLLDEEHSYALRYMVAQAGNYRPLDDDESWFQNLVP